jgi:hypothetical protein
MRLKKSSEHNTTGGEQELEARVEAFMSDKPLPEDAEPKSKTPEIDIFDGTDMLDATTAEETVDAKEISVGDADDEPEDETTKQAVDEIMTEDGDIVLAAVDAQVVEPPKFAKEEPKSSYKFPLITKLLVALAVAAIVVFIVDARAH